MIYYINADTGNDSTGNGSSALPWATFAKAYASASSGDEIVFQTSTAHYAWASLVISKNLTLSGQTDGGSIIDAGNANIGNGWAAAGYNITATLLSFKGLATTTVNGGGFRISDGSNFEFNQCRFYSNAINVASGGLFNFKTGIATPNCTLNSCLLYGNSTNTTAKLIYMYNGAEANMYVNNCSFHFPSNVGFQFATLAGGSGGVFDSLVLTNTIVLNEQTIALATTGTTGSYNCRYGTFGSGWNAITNSIVADPLFIDSTNNNYNLAPSSPCIDTGTLI